MQVPDPSTRISEANLTIREGLAVRTFVFGEPKPVIRVTSLPSLIVTGIQLLDYTGET